ncbi:MAG: hypothetical protein MZU95_14640 [Desulfomicrobium escambiense]|nr:hypothetical protein [Desulfomicrobium escambiense]
MLAGTLANFMTATIAGFLLMSDEYTRVQAAAAFVRERGRRACAGDRHRARARGSATSRRTSADAVVHALRDDSRAGRRPRVDRPRRQAGRRHGAAEGAWRCCRAGRTSTKGTRWRTSSFAHARAGGARREDAAAHQRGRRHQHVVLARAR